MIAPARHRGALLALNWELVRLRQLAHSGARHDVLAKCLDDAEYLPLLLTDEGDRTAEFRAVLVDLVQADDGFTLALDRFDDTCTAAPGPRS